MKGLLIKDLKLMKMNKTFFLLMIGISFVVMLVNESDPTFVISFLTIVSSMFTISTISYDEYDNGSSFLFTLPITRKDYAIEKYVFGLLVSGSVWGISSAVVIALQLIKNTPFLLSEIIMIAFIYLLLALIMISLTIPCQLKFGPEKGRIAMIIFVAAGFSISASLINIISDFNLNITDFFHTISLSFIILMLTGITILITYISSMISIRIMEKKQF